ncbi:thiosulfate oxidation carrier protein SoxY [Roseicella aquatilis]|uniref:Thiosulfate oxidation carrier protein SoxY n=1 Tax=Roseicella aquatilis TaxID=2527868 RepID=A0A4R4D372_9PROT|nr:thiosulfate oxidation carrier protein SoxY [Roseicella aquatilis]TCZ52760.1 thiosulfate oxidation carrier protein SoxY [Roseicella aquatilis]
MPDRHANPDAPADPARRAVLQLLAAAGLIALGTGRAAAAVPGWPEEAFRKTSQADALAALYGKPLEMSDKVTLQVPEIAENGAVVPVSVGTTLPNVTSVTLLVPENPNTLAASFKFGPGVAPAVSCRLKMAKTSPVIAVVESDGRLFGVSKEVKVTLGGCGG